MTAQSPSTSADRPAFLPLVDACNQRGICRSVAFQLAAAGQIETFRIGRRRYVLLASLDSLPERLPQPEQVA